MTCTECHAPTVPVDGRPDLARCARVTCGYVHQIA